LTDEELEQAASEGHLTSQIILLQRRVALLEQDRMADHDRRIKRLEGASEIWRSEPFDPDLDQAEQQALVKWNAEIDEILYGPIESATAVLGAKYDAWGVRVEDDGA
jgi:hypothetical protein